MRRRDFITLLGGAGVSWPLTGQAQQPAMPVIGFLDSGSFAANTRKVDAFRRGLAEAGYVENSNVVIEFRWADAQFWQLRPMADNLLRRQSSRPAQAVRLWRRRPPRRPSPLSSRPELIR